jgi:hypothetical protein
MANCATLVAYSNRWLPNEGNPTQLKLLRQRLFIHALQEPWPKVAMNLYGGTNHPTRQIVETLAWFVTKPLGVLGLLAVLHIGAIACDSDNTAAKN